MARGIGIHHEQRDRPHPSVRSAAKRMGDLVAAAVGLVLLAPVFAAVGLAIRLSLGRPVLFRQARSGYRGRPFTIYKFRTMREAHRADGVPLPDAERLTRLGRLLRRTSLDELPQLWNVLRGDLSLVGPRPQLAEYLPLYSPEQARRHEVRPGITGWAQVHGRNAIDWDEKFRHDLWYMDHWSPALDVKILALTITCVLRGEGINEPSAAMVTPFRGMAAYNHPNSSVALEPASYPYQTIQSRPEPGEEKVRWCGSGDSARANWTHRGGIPSCGVGSLRQCSSGGGPTACS